MEIRLCNIGIVQDSQLQINGLTVITGKNNSGKTTVGKILYSLIEATTLIKTKYENDRYRYLKNKLNFVGELFDSIRFYFSVTEDNDTENILKNYPFIHDLYDQQTFDSHDSHKLEQSIKQLIDEIKRFDISSIETGEKIKVIQSYYQTRYDMSLQEAFNKQKIEALRILEQSIEDVNKDPEQNNYIRESISQMLRVEFSEQIQPIRNKAAESSIVLEDEDRVYYQLKIINNRVAKTEKPVFTANPFKKSFLIDNPNVIDNPTGNSVIVRRKNNEELDTILNLTRFSLHNDKLASIISRPNRSSVLEQTILEERLENVRNKIDQIIPGTYEFTSIGGFYVEDGTKLNTSNLATGSKLFSIIKILLDRGYIQDSSLLIFDEPEAHLHPEWQNVFAEIVVLLVKELGTRIVLTSHSPNFVLALDAYMRKYKIEEQTDFYQTVRTEDGMVNYKCVNDDVSVIYQDFMEYLADVKVLRDSYID